MAVVDQKRPTIASILARAAQLHITLLLDDEGERLVVEASDPAAITEAAQRVFSERESELIAHLRAEYEEHAAQAEIDMAMDPPLCSVCLDNGDVVIASEEPGADDLHYCSHHGVITFFSCQNPR